MASLRTGSLLPAVRRTLELQSSALRSARAAQRIRKYHPAWRFQQEQIPQRYGTANEPPPHLGGGKGLGPITKEQQSQETKALPKIGEDLQRDGDKEVRTGGLAGDGAAKREPAMVDGPATAATSARMIDPMLDSSEATPSTQPSGAPKTADAKPMETILNSVPDPQQHSDQQKPSSDPHAE